MTETVQFNINTFHRFFLLFLLIATLTGCVTEPSSAIETEDGFLVKQSSILFFVSTPFDTAEGSEIYLDIVDELSDINLNPVRHKMQLVSENLYSVEILFPESSLVKYRYAMGSNPTSIERDSFGNPVHYRVVNTRQETSVVARDVVASWTDTPLNASLGRMEGKLVDAKTGTGIPDLVINLNGMQAISSSTGEFRIDNALPGKYILTIFHMNGSYEPFQQEAIIAPDSSTPVDIPLQPRATTQITFIVTPPNDHDPEIPIRLIGNTTLLGNTFSVRPGGGTSIEAVTAPLLVHQADGTYTLTLQLPVGMDLHYKYSIGDGFWNAERHTDGQSITRQLIIPEKDTTITEAIADWRAGDHEPIRIEVQPQPGDDLPQQLYIQLNSYIWTEPLPMWQNTEKNKWLYEVYSPLYLFSSIGYRFCYDAHCNEPIAANGAAETNGSSFPTDGSQPLIQFTLPPNDNFAVPASPSSSRQDANIKVWNYIPTTKILNMHLSKLITSRVPKWTTTGLVFLPPNSRKPLTKFFPLSSS